MNATRTSVRLARRGLAPLAALLGFGTLATAVLLAQPENLQPPAGGERPAAQPRPGKGVVNRPGMLDREVPSDPAALREFIHRRIERMQAALKDLDNNADAAEVGRRLFRDLRQSLNEGRDRASGPGGEDGPVQPNGEPRPNGRQGPDGGFEPRMGGGQPSMIGEPMVRLPEFERKAAMEVIRAERADLADRIEAVSRQPEVRDRVYDMLGARLKGLPELKRSDAESLGLRLDEIRGLMDIMAVTADYARHRHSGADESTLQPLRDRLRAATAEQFDLRIKVQQRSVEKLLSHSEKLRSDLDRLRNDRDRIIDEKTQQILRLADRPRGKGPGNTPPQQPPK